MYDSPAQIYGIISYELNPTAVTSDTSHIRSHALPSAFMHDGGWHHLCARWRNSEGKWCVHVNGDMTCYENYKTGQTIQGNGKFYLGGEEVVSPHLRPSLEE